MSVSLKTHKMLWGRAAGRCYLPDCRRRLVMDATDTDDPSLVGEAAHIVAESSAGPRGDDPLPMEKRNLYDNLMLLCATHHTLVDDQVNAYTVEKLHAMKREHEEWVSQSLPDGFDPQKQRDDEYWAGIIDEWAARADLAEWSTWSSWVFGPDAPRLREDAFLRLRELDEWLLSRVWPQRYERLQEALMLFRVVLDGFLRVFHRHSIDIGWGEPKMLTTEKFYKLRVHEDEQVYRQLVREFEFHCGLVQDLMIETTRAANLVCNRVREFLDGSFRRSEGVLLVEIDTGLHHRMTRAEYREQDLREAPYDSLEHFMRIRHTRAQSFGRGASWQDEVGHFEGEDAET